MIIKASRLVNANNIAARRCWFSGGRQVGVVTWLAKRRSREVPAAASKRHPLNNRTHTGPV